MKLLPEIKLRNPFATRYDNVDRGDMVNPFTIVDYSDPYGMFGLFKRLKIYSEAADTISILEPTGVGERCMLQGIIIGEFRWYL